MLAGEARTPGGPPTLKFWSFYPQERNARESYTPPPLDVRGSKNAVDGCGCFWDMVCACVCVRVRVRVCVVTNGSNVHCIPHLMLKSNTVRSKFRHTPARSLVGVDSTPM